MNYNIPMSDFPSEVKRSSQLTPEEKNKPIDPDDIAADLPSLAGSATQEKSAKNSKVAVRKMSYNITVREKYKKPVRRGDKIQNMNKKKKK